MSTQPQSAGGRIRSRFADDPDMQPIVEMFVDEMPERIASLRSAWEASEIERLRRLAHQLKGSGGGYGFPALGDAAGRLEAAIQQLAGGGSLASLERLRQEFDELVGLCQRVSKS